jgi:hypothetical protein
MDFNKTKKESQVIEIQDETLGIRREVFVQYDKKNDSFFEFDCDLSPF